MWLKQIQSVYSELFVNESDELFEDTSRGSQVSGENGNLNPYLAIAQTKPILLFLLAGIMATLSEPFQPVRLFDALCYV